MASYQRLAIFLISKNLGEGTAHARILERQNVLHAPVKKQTRYANRAKAFAPHQNFGPAISEAAESRFATVQRYQTAEYPFASGLRRGLASIGVSRSLRSVAATPRFSGTEIFALISAQ